MSDTEFMRAADGTARNERPAGPAGDAAWRGAAREPGGNGGSRGQLLGAGELRALVGRWREIQAEFVDEPSTAVMDADALVSDLMLRLTEVFATERAALESRLTSSGELSTEDLRQALQRYRTFFERLLAA